MMVDALDEHLLSNNNYFNSNYNYYNDSWPLSLKLKTLLSIHNNESYIDSKSVHYGSKLAPSSLSTTAQQQQYSTSSMASQKEQKQQQQQKYYRYHNHHKQRSPQTNQILSHKSKQHQQMPLSSYSQQYPYAYNPNQIMRPPEDNWNSWNRVFKLLLLSFVSTIGSMGAIFIISAITVIDTFQVRGNCFLVSISFGHLLVTILILPSSAIAIMADITEDVTLCHFQWLITLSCFIITFLSFLFLAIDNYFGMKSLNTYQLCCTKCRIFFLIILIWFIGFLIPFLQHQNHFGPEFCKDKKHWKMLNEYHPYILGILILCTIITLSYFTYSLFMYKNYKIQFETSPEAATLILTDGCLLQSNVIVYIFSLAMWIPLFVTMVIDSINPVQQDYLDTVWYIAISNSCTYSYLYAATNRDFRDAFNKLFYYCCCKSHVTFSRKNATIRRTVANESMGLRVHIIPGLNIYAQRKDNMNNSNFGGNYGASSSSAYRSGGFGSSSGAGGGGSFFHGGGSGSHGNYYSYNRSLKSCEL